MPLSVTKAYLAGMFNAVLFKETELRKRRKALRAVNEEIGELIRACQKMTDSLQLIMHTITRLQAEVNQAGEVLDDTESEDDSLHENESQGSDEDPDEDSDSDSGPDIVSNRSTPVSSHPSTPVIDTLDTGSLVCPVLCDLL